MNQAADSTESVPKDLTAHTTGSIINDLASDSIKSVPKDIASDATNFIKDLAGTGPVTKELLLILLVCYLILLIVLMIEQINVDNVFYSGL